MTRIKMAIGILVLTLFAGMLLGCEEKNEVKVPDDATELCTIYNACGYQATMLQPSTGMLASIQNEMEQAIGLQLEEQLVGYVYAKNSLGVLASEVFIFENKRDAEKLHDFFAGEERFSNGEAEVRVCGKVVYMGYTDALDIIERS